FFDAAVEWAAGAPTDGPPIEMPRATTVAAGNVTLAWFTSTTGLRHEIRRAARPGGPYTLIATSTSPGTPDPELGASYTYTDTTVVTGQTYYYAITPLDAAGRRGRTSAEVVTTLAVPGPATIRNEYFIDQNGNLLSIN